MATFEDIINALSFVSSDSYGMNRALLCLDSGKMYFHSEIGDPENDELYEERFDCSNFIEIPHKNDLGLGVDLVIEFAQERMPGDIDRIISFFGSRGAYRRFRDLLEHRGLLQCWYDFEKERDKEAPRKWIDLHKIELEPDDLQAD